MKILRTFFLVNEDTIARAGEKVKGHSAGASVFFG